jgi:hypothetical protein
MFCSTLSYKTYTVYLLEVIINFQYILLLLLLLYLLMTEDSQDSVVGIATGYVLDDQGVGIRAPVGARIFTPPPRPDRLRGPPSLLSKGYRWLLPQGYSGRGAKLTTHL